MMKSVLPAQGITFAVVVTIVVTTNYLKLKSCGILDIIRFFRGTVTDSQIASCLGGSICMCRGECCVASSSCLANS